MGGKMSVRGSFPSDVVQTAKRVRESQAYCMISSFPSFLCPFLVPISPNFSHDCGLPLPSPKPRLTWWEHLLGKRRARRLLLLPGALLILFLGSSPSWPRLQAGLSAFLRCQHWHQGLSPTTWHLVFCELGKKPGRGARGCQCFGVTV